MPQDEFIDDIPFPETQNYVKRILGTAEDYRYLYGGGLLDPNRASRSLAVNTAGKTTATTAAPRRPRPRRRRRRRSPPRSRCAPRTADRCSMVDRLLDLTRQAEARHFWFHGFRSYLLPVFAAAVAGRPHARILDVGCGTGYNLGLLARHGAAVGLDLNERGLALARDIGRPLLRADTARLPFADDTFDLVTSFDMMQCIPTDREAVREMARVRKTRRGSGHLDGRARDPPRRSLGGVAGIPALYADVGAGARRAGGAARGTGHVHVRGRCFR